MTYLGSLSRGLATSFALGGLAICACNRATADHENIGVAAQPLSSFGPGAGCGAGESCYAGMLGGPGAGTPLPAKTLALTIDDGPGMFASQISTYLKSLGIRTVFFVNGNRLKTSADLPNENNIQVTPGADGIIAQILADGHLVANHTVTHRDMATDVYPNGGANQVLLELQETDTDIAGYVPSGFYLFRSPYGDFNQNDYTALKGTAMNKYAGPVYWDMGGVSTNYPSQAADWACWQGQITCGSVDAALGCPSVGALAYGTGYLTTAQCGDAYLKEIESVGHGIILDHDPYSWAHGNSYEMLQYYLPKLLALGYKFVRIDEVPDVRAALPPCDASCATCDGVTADQCRTCVGDRYLDGTACPLCTACDAGTYESAACTRTANTVCTACDDSCATCTGPAATDCTGCGPNAYLSGRSCVACTACAAGSYVAQGCTAGTDAICTPCSAGTYSSTANANACVSCAPGTFSDSSGVTACTDCPAGTRAETEGQTACTACAVGQFADAGATSCGLCKAGTYASTLSGACLSCAPGTSSTDGAGACTACAAGSYAGSGAPACTSCAAGTFAASPGSTACVACAAGASSPPGAKACDACAAGSYAADAGSSACATCSNCDDGNACTTDACSGTSGCTHTAIGGCGTSQEAPSAPGGDAGAPAAAPVAAASSGCATTGPGNAGDAALIVLTAIGAVVSRRRRTRPNQARRNLTLRANA